MYIISGLAAMLRCHYLCGIELGYNELSIYWSYQQTPLLITYIDDEKHKN